MVWLACWPLKFLALPVIPHKQNHSLQTPLNTLDLVAWWVEIIGILLEELCSQKLNVSLILVFFV